MKGTIKWKATIGVFIVMAIAATVTAVPVAMADNVRPQASVNINTADAEELASLPGIGSAKAEAIVIYRGEHGPFATVEELTNIRGIGSSILERIRGLIRLK